MYYLALVFGHHRQQLTLQLTTTTITYFQLKLRFRFQLQHLSGDEIYFHTIPSMSKRINYTSFYKIVEKFVSGSTYLLWYSNLNIVIFCYHENRLSYGWR